MLEQLLKLIPLLASTWRILLIFFTAVVLPVTGWFFATNYGIKENKLTLEAHASQIVAIKAETDLKISKVLNHQQIMEDRFERQAEKISRSLEEIQRSLGRLEGRENEF